LKEGCRAPGDDPSAAAAIEGGADVSDSLNRSEKQRNPPAHRFETTVVRCRDCGIVLHRNPFTTKIPCVDRRLHVWADSRRDGSVDWQRCTRCGVTRSRTRSSWSETPPECTAPLPKPAATTTPAMRVAVDPQAPRPAVASHVPRTPRGSRRAKSSGGGWDEISKHKR
jgi:hypothetical protein